MKTILKSDHKNTAIAALKQLCLIKYTQQHSTKTKAEEQEEGRNENKLRKTSMSLDLITGKGLASFRTRT